ncbi:hypothetical protein I380019A4_11490 [Sutterella wadsworthensis]|jgi:hypothetical protein
MTANAEAAWVKHRVPGFQHLKLKRIIIGVSALFCLIPPEEVRLTLVTLQHRPED